jgi:hypothetical protein
MHPTLRSAVARARRQRRPGSQPRRRAARNRRPASRRRRAVARAAGAVGVGERQRRIVAPGAIGAAPQGCGGTPRSPDAGARRRARANYWGLVYITVRDRSSVSDRLALRPEFSTQARMPPTAQFPAPRGGRLGLPVLTAGSVWGQPARHPPVRRSGPDFVERSGVLALFPPRGVNRGTGGLRGSRGRKTTGQPAGVARSIAIVDPGESRRRSMPYEV